MASGKQRSEENIAAFVSWVASKTDSDYREMTTRGQLSRQEIARECDFGRSVLIQNPRVSEALRALEDDLRKRGVLPPLAALSTQASQASSTHHPQSSQTRGVADQLRLKRLEAENASLRAEVAQLRLDLNRYRVMEAVLAETGRLPR